MYQSYLRYFSFGAALAEAGSKGAAFVKGLKTTNKAFLFPILLHSHVFSFETNRSEIIFH